MAVLCGLALFGRAAHAGIDLPEWIDPAGWDEATAAAGSEGVGLPESVFVADRWLLGVDELADPGVQMLTREGREVVMLVRVGGPLPGFELRAIDLADPDQPRTRWSTPVAESGQMPHDARWRLEHDGEALLLSARADGQNTLWRGDAASGEVTAAPRPAEPWQPTGWVGHLPDGRPLFSARADDGRTEGASLWAVSDDEAVKLGRIAPLEGDGRGGQGGRGGVEAVAVTASGQIIALHSHLPALACHDPDTGAEQWRHRLGGVPERVRIEGGRVLIDYPAGIRGPAALDAADGRVAGYRDSRGRARRIGGSAAGKAALDLFLVPDGAHRGWAILAAAGTEPVWAALAGEGQYHLLTAEGHATAMLVAPDSHLWRGYAFTTETGRQKAIVTLIGLPGRDGAVITTPPMLGGDPSEPILIGDGRLFRRLEPRHASPPGRGADAVVARIADRRFFTRPGVARGLEMPVRAARRPEQRATFHALLEHDSPRVQRAVARALLLAGDRRSDAVDILARLLESPDDTAEAFELPLTAEALVSGEPPSPRWLLALLEHLDHPDPLWRTAAAESLHALLPARWQSDINPRIVDAVTSRLETEPHAAAQLACLRLLQGRGSDSEPARPLARRVLQAPHTRSDVAVAAIHLLDVLGLREADVPLLLEHWRSGSETVRNAAEAVLLRTDQPVTTHVVPWLSDPQLTTRLRATQMLRLLGPAAMDAGASLAPLLGAREPRLRESALETFLAIEADAAEAVAPLRRMLALRNGPEVRRGVVEALGRIGPAAYGAGPDLLAMFDDPAHASDAALQIRLIKAISQIGEHERFASQARALARRVALEQPPMGQDPSANLRAAALRVLGRGGLEPDERARIEALLEAASPTVRRAAMEVLLAHGHDLKPAIERLLSAADAQRQRRGLGLIEAAGVEHIADAGALAGPLAKLLAVEDPQVHDRAQRLLLAMGPRSRPATAELVRIVTIARQPAADLALDVIIELGDEAIAALLNRYEPMLLGRNESRRQYALKLARTLGAEAKSVLPLICRTLAENHRYIEDARPWVAAMTAIDPAQPAVVEALVVLIEHGTEDHRLTAAQGLNQLGERARGALRPLIALLDDPLPRIRMHAASTLGRIGAPAADALPRLHELRQSNDPHLRMRAGHAARLIERALQRHSDAG